MMPLDLPEYPKRATQPARLLAALLLGQKINPLIAWTRLGIYRLSATVFQLRQMGWPVVTNRRDVENRFGEECHVAEYYLSQDNINSTGQTGKEFARDEIQMPHQKKAA